MNFDYSQSSELGSFDRPLWSSDSSSTSSSKTSCTAKATINRREQSTISSTDKYKYPSKPSSNSSTTQLIANKHLSAPPNNKQLFDECLQGYGLNLERFKERKGCINEAILDLSLSDSTRFSSSNLLEVIKEFLNTKNPISSNLLKTAFSRNHSSLVLGHLVKDWIPKDTDTLECIAGLIEKGLLKQLSQDSALLLLQKFVARGGVFSSNHLSNALKRVYKEHVIEYILSNLPEKATVSDDHVLMAISYGYSPNIIDLLMTRYPFEDTESLLEDALKAACCDRWLDIQASDETLLHILGKISHPENVVSKELVNEALQNKRSGAVIEALTAKLRSETPEKITKPSDNSVLLEIPSALETLSKRLSTPCSSLAEEWQLLQAMDQVARDGGGISLGIMKKALLAPQSSYVIHYLARGMKNDDFLKLLVDFSHHPHPLEKLTYLVMNFTKTHERAVSVALQALVGHEDFHYIQHLLPSLVFSFIEAGGTKTPKLIEIATSRMTSEAQLMGYLKLERFRHIHDDLISSFIHKHGTISPELLEELFNPLNKEIL